MNLPQDPNLKLGALSFADDFSTLDIDTPNDQNSPWSPAPGGQFGSLSARTLASNNESEVYVDPSFRGVAQYDSKGNFVSAAVNVVTGMPETIYGRPGWSGNPPAWTQFGPTSLGLNPFSITSEGYLRITATKTPATLKPLLWNRDWYTGELVTQPSGNNVGFAQQYGYFETSMKVPKGQGLWPAFWLMPLQGWPPEFDVLEVLGNDTTTAYQSVHSNNLNPHGKTVGYKTGDLSLAFHQFGMLWTPQWIVFFVDGKENWRIATPLDMTKQKAYMILNLAVGGRSLSGGLSWGGAYDLTTPDPAYLDIDWVRVYDLDPALVIPPTPMDITVPGQVKKTVQATLDDNGVTYTGTLTEV